MGYSSILEVELVLAQALTSGRPQETTTSGRTKIIGIGGISHIRDTNRVPDETVQQYISYADSLIDGVLTQQYFTPFKKCANGQWALDEDINAAEVAGTTVAGTDSAGDTIAASPITIVVNDAVNLVPGDEILLIDDLLGTQEVAIVATLVDQYTFTVTSAIEETFLADNDVRVVRSQFPPPLNQISARYAASYIYDKYFAAQASPNISEYGKEMRSISAGQLNDVLNGKTILKCARRRGDIFGNPWLDSSYTHREPYGGYNSNDRDMSKPQ